VRKAAMLRAGACKEARRSLGHRERWGGARGESALAIFFSLVPLTHTPSFFMRPAPFAGSKPDAKTVEMMRKFAEQCAKRCVFCFVFAGAAARRPKAKRPDHRGLPPSLSLPHQTFPTRPFCPTRTDTFFCVDKSVTAVVIQGLAEHKEELGAPLCPCR